MSGRGFNAKRKRHIKIDVAGRDFDFVNVAVGNGDDIHAVDVLDFSGAEVDGKDLAEVVVVFDDVADVVIVIGDDFEAAENIFHRVLQGEADNDRSDADAGEHRANIDAEKLKDD